MGLFEKENKYVKQTIAFDNNGTPFLKTITLLKNDGTKTNIDQLITGIKEAIKDKSNEDSIEKVDYLASAILGPYASVGFKVAWIMKAIINKYEHDNKTKLTINVESTELTKADMKKYTLEWLKNIQDAIEKDENEVIGKLVDPTNNLAE